jgi:hypothetical protein
VIRRMLGLGAAACLLVGTTAGGASAAVAGGAGTAVARGARAVTASSIWQVVPSANPQPHLVTDSEFAGVSMGSATNDLNQLTGVVAISSNNAWASGSEGNVNGQNFHIPYVEHWNGTTWSLVKTPNRGGEGSLLNGITALGPGDVWAVGQTQQLNGAIAPMTDQFNGTAWSVVPSPVPGSSGRIPDDSLDGAASLSGGLVFAVGARDIPGQCCLRTLGLKTSAG